MDILNKSLLDLTGSFENELILGRTVLMNLGLGSGITPPIPPYEPYYEVLEYITLDGTQYFNPDLLTNADYTIEARFKLTDTSSSSSVFGGRNTSANPMNGNQLHYIYTNGKTQYIGGYSTSELAVENAITLNDVCEVVCDKTGFSIAKNGGTPTKHSKSFSGIEYTTDLMIGATYTKTGDSIQFGFKGEFYMFKVRLNGELIRDYVPALDSQLRPCLYDKVTKTFLYAKKISGNAETYDLGLKRWNKFDVDYIEDTEITGSYKPVIWHNGDTTAVAALYDEVYNKIATLSGNLKAYILGADNTVYEVGIYVQTLKTSNTSNAGYVVELGEYPQDGMGYHIKTTTTSDNSNYLFGARKPVNSGLQLITLSGSSTNGTILSTVTGTSITWKSNKTDWKRAGTTTYECSIQTYIDENNAYKFNAIGYNYTLGKEADRQTATYTSSIDSQSDIPMLYFGAFNTLNILYGDNSHYFVEWNLPDTRHTLLPVTNTAHTQFCFIDNKTKEIYEFQKVGAPSPSSNNVNFKQLDGTVITGTL